MDRIGDWQGFLSFFGVKTEPGAHRGKDALLAVLLALTAGTILGFLPEMTAFLSVFILTRHVVPGFYFRSCVRFVQYFAAASAVLFGALICLPEDICRRLTVLLALLSLLLIVRFGAVITSVHTVALKKALRHQRVCRIAATVLASALTALSTVPGWYKPAFSGILAMTFSGFLQWIASKQAPPVRSWNAEMPRAARR